MANVISNLPDGGTSTSYVPQVIPDPELLQAKLEAAEAKIARIIEAGDRMAHPDSFLDYSKAVIAWQQAKADAPASQRPKEQP